MTTESVCSCTTMCCTYGLTSQAAAWYVHAHIVLHKQVRL